MIFAINDPDSMARAISAIAQCEFGKTEVVIRRQKKTRNHQQNRYYWAIVNCIAQFAGESTDFLHEQIKQRYCRPKILRSVRTGDEIAIYTTANLSTTEFAGLIDEVIALAGRMNIRVPYPDDPLVNKFLEAYGYEPA